MRRMKKQQVRWDEVLSPILAIAAAVLAIAGDVMAQEPAPPPTVPYNSQARRSVQFEVEEEIEKQIQLTIQVFQIDAAKLQVRGFDLDKVLGKRLSPSPAEQAAPRIELVTDRELTLLSELLRATEAAKIISSPRLITLNGQEATVQIGQETPLLAREENFNGVRRIRVEQITQGLLATLTPKLIDDETFSIEATIEQSSLMRDETDATAATPAIPRLRSNKLQARVCVEKGKSVVWLQPAAPGGRRDDSSLLVTISPSLITREQMLINERRVRPSPPPSPVAAHSEMEQLRAEVQQLRQEMSRLIELLESREGDLKESAQYEPAPDFLSKLPHLGRLFVNEPLPEDPAPVPQPTKD